MRMWILMAVAACNGQEVGVTGPTYYQDVAPILHLNCSGCHKDDGLNPVLQFGDYTLAVSYSDWLNGEIQEETMPPFYARESDECENPWGFTHDPRLTETDKAIVQEWLDAGTPEGDPATAAPLIEPPSVRLEGTEDFYPAQSYTTPPFSEVQDQFVCFALDAKRTQTGWLEGFEVLPGNPQVVHHVLTGVGPDPTGTVTVNEDGTYPCFGGFGVPGVQFIGGWVPGAPATRLPAYSAIPVQSGEFLFLQIHYHMAESSESDLTGLGVLWGEQAPVRQAAITLIGNANQASQGLQPGPNDPEEGPAFYIPAGVSGHTETMTFAWEPDLLRGSQVFMIANHMHYVGTDMRVMTEGDSGEQCLLQTPDWDFDWQQFYSYDTDHLNAPVLNPSDDLTLQCTFDNTTGNPQVMQALAEAGESSPLPVELGEGSLDEMCLVLMGTVAEIDLDMEDSTHSGTLESLLQVSLSGDWVDLSCDGPAHIDQVGNAFTGIAACGVAFGEAFYTMEFSLEGTISGEVVSGTSTLNVVNVLEGASLVEGSFSGQLTETGAMQLGFNTELNPGGIDFVWAGSMEMSPTMAE